VPTPAEIKARIRTGDDLWNAGDREGWLAHVRSYATTMRREDPVGTPVKEGADALEEVWDRSRPALRQRRKVQYLFVCGQEAAAWVVTKAVVDGQTVWWHGAECTRFDADGTVHTRAFWEPPAERLDYLAWSAATGTPPTPGPGLPGGGVAPVESPEVTKAKLRRGYELYNFGTKEEWLANMRADTTEPLLEDPIGAPLKRGWDLMSEAWDRAPARHRLRVIPEHIVVCGREAAVLSMNAGTVQDKPMFMVSIDCSRRNEDGSRHSRTFWEEPEGGLAYARWAEHAE